MVPFTILLIAFSLWVFWREVWFLMAMAYMCRHTGLVVPLNGIEVSACVVSA
ncbi:hypothetical protein BGX38DRAFT_1229200 [Terfezia claveryi]|nr:hypothetical protein BGX38DRAFT_1229200 [Terfezia claveryi]